MRDAIPEIISAYTLRRRAASDIAWLRAALLLDVAVLAHRVAQVML